MSDKQALTDLLAKVEAGSHLPSGLIFEAFGGPEHVGDVREAHNGSLDAALALHNAVLGGWFFCAWGLTKGKLAVSVSRANPIREQFHGKADTPSCAWLIAIIKALISQEDAQ